jgi:hypothetical protein
MAMTDEVERLRRGPQVGEKPKGTVASFNLICDGNADEVLERCREALGSVLTQSADPWPSVEHWGRVLPTWFVAACFPEITREEAQRRRALPLEQRERLAEQWSVAAWIYWFRPSERSWYWWNAKVIDANHAQVQVVTESIPFAMGSLKWLCKAAGARQVSEPQAALP